MTDHQLIEKLKKGEQKAFEALYERYAEKIFKVGIRFGLKKEDAVEIVQDVFVKVWERRAELRLDLSFNAYLLTITKNFIIKKSRKNATDLAFQQYYFKLQDTSDNSVEDLMVFADLFDITGSFIESLPPQQRDIFRMSKIDQLSHLEISKRLKLSVRTVENHVFRATSTLRQKLKKVGVMTCLFLLISWLSL